MARKVDNKRYHENIDRREYYKKRNSEYAKQNKLKSQARQILNRSVRENPHLIPDKCPIT